MKESVKQSQRISKNVNERLEECNDAYTKGAFKYLRLLVHFLGTTQFCYALYYWEFYVNIPVGNTTRHWGGKFKFLTYLNVILQAGYHLIALLNDLFGSNDIYARRISGLRKMRDSIFISFAFPIALNVCLSFWVVYLFDRELIFPRGLDAYFPYWLNHVVHTNVALLIIIDLFTCFRQYNGKSGLKSTTVIMLLYVAWLHLAHYHNERWAYPLFDALNWPMRYFMLFGIVFVSIFCYFLGEFINNTLWASELKLLQQKLKLKEN